MYSTYDREFYSNTYVLFEFMETALTADNMTRSFLIPDQNKFFKVYMPLKAQFLLLFSSFIVLVN
jgi:hypothetical protein